MLDFLLGFFMVPRVVGLGLPVFLIGETTPPFYSLGDGESGGGNTDRCQRQSRGQSIMLCMTVDIFNQVKN